MRLDFNTFVTRIGRWCSVFSLGLLTFAALSSVVTWYVAKRDGKIIGMQEYLSLYQGFQPNHGPWRHYDAGRQLMLTILLLIFSSGAISVVSFVFKPKPLALSLVLISFLALIVFGQFYWLID